MLDDFTRRTDRDKWWSIHDPENYVCPDCGMTPCHPEFEQWEIHHIDAEPGNIVALCQTCHKIRHGAKPSKVSVERWKESLEAL